MKITRSSLLAFGTSCLLISNGALCLAFDVVPAEPAKTAAKVLVEDSRAPQDLVVSIASLTIDGRRSIGSGAAVDHAPHFDIVLRNTSDKSLNLWAEDCSMGNGSLTLEIVAIDGKPLTPPVVVDRRVATWDANWVHGVTLAAGDVTVRDVHLYAYKLGEREKAGSIAFLLTHPGNYVDYMGFPALTQSDVHLVRMRAVFEITPNDWTKTQKIWTGRAVSETRDYVVWGVYP